MKHSFNSALGKKFLFSRKDSSLQKRRTQHFSPLSHHLKRGRSGEDFSLSRFLAHLGVCCEQNIPHSYRGGPCRPRALSEAGELNSPQMMIVYHPALLYPAFLSEPSRS